MEKNKHVIVASHRRSGTHLTIDAVINNFKVFSQNSTPVIVTLDHLSSHVPQQKIDLRELQKQIASSPCLLKTHAHGNISKFFIGTSHFSAFIHELFQDSKIIVVHRDGRDVLTSLYFYMQGFDQKINDTTLSEFIRMKNNFDEGTYPGEMDRVSYWGFHVDSWLGEDNVLLLSFDDFQNKYVETLKKISQFIEHPLDGKVKDVKRQKESKVIIHVRRYMQKLITQRFIRIKYSSVNFRKGESGDWVNYFSDDDQKYFNPRAGLVNQALGYQSGT